MRLGSALWIPCLFVIASSGRVEYCGSRVCGNTDAHTFCKFRPGPGPRCTGYIEASLTAEEQSRLLERLNRRRHDAASGRLRGMPSAGNMMKLRWIDELAKEAQLWANQCRPPSYPEERDECRDLYSISVGQCVASVVGEAPGLRVESMVDLWYMQSLLYKGNVTSYVPAEDGRHFYGDFGQMLWARSFMVGCGRSRFMTPWQGRLQSVERLVCNVSPAGPAPYRPLWTPAAPTSLCPSRSHPDGVYTALCDYQFQMNESDVVDDTITMEEHILLNSVREIERNESPLGLRSLDEQYFANLATVTMDNMNASTSTTLLNSLQNRSVDENVNISNGVAKVMRDTHTELKTTLIKADNIDSKIHNYKIRTIGRPRPYNMEELTETGDDHKENNYERIGEVARNYIYGDYDTGTQENEMPFAEVPKVENKSEVSDSISDKIGNKTTDENSMSEHYQSTIQTLTDATKFRIELNMNVDNTTLSETLLSKYVEDYINDPETVRQLQHALDRMESDMLNSKITSKVRRELRDLPRKTIDTSSDRIGRSLSPQAEQNRTVDRGPMLNMVLKYMPYLKEYENEILGNVNSSSRVSFGIISYALMFYLLSL